MLYTPVQTTDFPKIIKIKAKVWHFINGTFFKYSPFFARKYRVLLVRLFGGDIHWTCSLNRLAIIDYPWNLKMRALSSLGENSWAYCLDKIEIGEKCCIGKDVYLLTGSHNFNSSSFDLITNPIKIGDGVWISTRANILPNVKIGAYAVIGFGSIVTKDVPPWTIVGGNPAKFIKNRVIHD